MDMVMVMVMVMVKGAFNCPGHTSKYTVYEVL